MQTSTRHLHHPEIKKTKKQTNSVLGFCFYRRCVGKTCRYLNFLEGVGDHSNEHVEQDDDDDEREDAVEDPPYKLCQHVLWHVHVVLVGHTEHGPE